jgi:hypothetical protein
VSGETLHLHVGKLALGEQALVSQSRRSPWDAFPHAMSLWIFVPLSTATPGLMWLAVSLSSYLIFDGVSS